MLFIIFTAEGLAEAESEILQHKAALWLNPSVKLASDLAVFEKQAISIHVLPDEIDGNNEKAVLSALSYVESNTTDKEIFVEYL